MIPLYRRRTQPPNRGVSAPNEVAGLDIHNHYSHGAELVADFAGSKRRLPEEAVLRVAAIEESLAVRERYRLRRLRVRQHVG